MADQVKILGIAGSLRKKSYNRGALRAAQQPWFRRGRSSRSSTSPASRASTRTRKSSPPAKVVELKSRIRAAGRDPARARPSTTTRSPGVLKNAIDWASRPYGDSAWNGKPVAIMGASVGVFGTVRAQYHLRQCFVFLNMDAVLQPEVAIGNAADKFDAQGNLTDERRRS